MALPNLYLIYLESEPGISHAVKIATKIEFCGFIWCDVNKEEWS